MTILLVALNHGIACAMLKFHLLKGKNEAKRKAANLCGFEPISSREVSSDPCIKRSSELFFCFFFLEYH